MNTLLAQQRKPGSQLDPGVNLGDQFGHDRGFQVDPADRLRIQVDPGDRLRIQVDLGGQLDPGIQADPGVQVDPGTLTDPDLETLADLARSALALAA